MTLFYRFIMFFTMCFITIVPFIIAEEAPKPQQKEQLFFTLDDRKWKIGYHHEIPDNSNLAEFILEGEDIENWNEIFTVHWFNLPLNPQDFANAFLKELENAVEAQKSEKFSHKNLSSADKSMTLEWSILDNTANHQYEMTRIISTNSSGTYVIRYTTKNTENLDKTRDKWLKILDEAYISDSDNKWKKSTTSWYALTKDGIKTE